MTSIPHLAFGLFTGAVVASSFQMADPLFTSDIAQVASATAAVLVGSLVPDLDAPGAPLARMLPFIAKPIQRRWAHRTLLHSLLGILIASGLVYYAVDFLAVFLPIPSAIPFVVCVFFLAGMFGHLLVDSLTINGVKWLHPYARAFAFPSAIHRRVRTGDRKEAWFTLLFLALFASYLPVLKAGGTSRAIHRTFKNFQMARADYVQARGIETFLSFEGSYRHNRTPVFGRSLILDATEQYFTIYFGEKVRTIGDNALILGTEYVCEYTNRAPRLFELSLINQPMDTILAQIPEGVLATGELTAPTPFQADAPLYADTDFKTVAITTTKISLAYASKAEVAGLNIRINEAVRKQHNRIRTLRADSVAVETEIDSLTRRLGAEHDLVSRYELRKQLDELKTERKRLEATLLTGQRNTANMKHRGNVFSGKLMLRELPPQNQGR